MKHCFFLIIFSFFMLSGFALSQESSDLTIQKAIDACITLRDAVSENDSTAIQKAADELQSCTISDFETLRCKDDSIYSIDGHLVFKEEFAKLLPIDKDVYNKADSISKKRSIRGQFTDGSIKSKTYLIKAAGSTKYSFSSKGHKEIAVVSESGGLVTMRIHVTNSKGYNENFNDDTNVRKGMPHRQKSFDLPTDCMNTVVLDVINCVNKDISVVIISN